MSRAAVAAAAHDAAVAVAGDAAATCRTARWGTGARSGTQAVAAAAARDAAAPPAGEFAAGRGRGHRLLLLLPRMSQQHQQ